MANINSYAKGEQPKYGCIININCPLHKAAPDMYEALKELRAYQNFIGTLEQASIMYQRAILHIDQALAKAEGKLEAQNG